MDARIRIDDSVFRAALREMPRQIPFAISYAMNQTAKDSVVWLRKDIHQVFTIRNNWEAMGITFNASTKKDLRVEIGSRHDYMAAQVTGGVKRGKDGGHVAIPQVGRGMPRATLRSKTTPPKWPKAIIADGATGFIGTVQTKRGPVHGAWRRVTRDTRSGKIVGGVARASRLSDRRSVFVNRSGRERSNVRSGLKLLYTLTPWVKIDRRWPMQRQVETIWSARWPEQSLSAIEYAIRTSHEKAKRAHVAGHRYGPGSNQFGGKLVPTR